MADKRKKPTRRKRLVRNLHSYLNRRDLFKPGRRKDDAIFDEGIDWFDLPENKPKK